uniref:Succinyl-diaminopimelate desuccinylase n=1 Tax=uncultured gamma proteobacterium HF0200_24F15 TaxID=723570 RepID=E7C3Y7_9GAMM|nr:acetylornithine deacetylase/succinyl-diaminopimelate desuccinylase and related deacylases [uncultured gamma proteobacterium HF0200_24F15]
MNIRLSIEKSTLKLAQNLIRRASVTPEDGGCQQLISEALKPFGFVSESFDFGGVHNIWLRRGTGNPLIVFAGHTDVVPTGSLERWRFPPFSAIVSQGLLHGRGAADMKGSIAAMVTACQRFAATNQNHTGSIGFLITSDEEGPAINGTKHVITELQKRGESFKWCIVGEPTSRKRIGDTIKNGRRGSLNGTLNLRGIQGHVAYPHLARNPIHHAAPLIVALTNHEWDSGNEDFPPTTLQISNIRGGSGATNVIPDEIEIIFNFRFSPESTVPELQDKFQDICKEQTNDFTIDWQPASPMYHTPAAELVKVARKIIRAKTGIKPTLATDGGTSDGRFISGTGAQVIELGPINRTIHSSDEHVRVSDLGLLSEIYEDILTDLLT